MKILITSLLIVGFISHAVFGSVGLFDCQGALCHTHAKCDAPIAYNAACPANLHNFNFSLYQAESYQQEFKNPLLAQQTLISWLSLHEHSPSVI